MKQRLLARMCSVGLITLAVGACGAGGAGQPGSASLTATRSGNAVVLSGEQLWERSGDLLSVMASRVSFMRVRRSGTCPQITMRGEKTLVGPSDPYIYVNGTQAGNTCLLEMMRSEDVERVEIYPMGVTQRPGYAPNPNGVILIFLRSAGSGESSDVYQ